MTPVAWGLAIGLIVALLAVLHVVLIVSTYAVHARALGRLLVAYGFLLLCLFCLGFVSHNDTSKGLFGGVGILLALYIVARFWGPVITVLSAMLHPIHHREGYVSAEEGWE